MCRAQPGYNAIAAIASASELRVARALTADEEEFTVV